MILLKLIDKLNEKKCRYAIAGGFAVAFHGAVRATMDIDLVVVLKQKELDKLESAMNELGYKSILPLTAKEIFSFRKEYIEKRNLIAWTFHNTDKPMPTIDVIITHDLDKMKTKTISVGGKKVVILSKVDLIRMKKQAGRPKDLIDIEALEKLDEIE